MTRFELACACAVDAIVGDPPALLHPVQAMGAIIAVCDRRYLRTTPLRDLLAGGVLAIALTTGSAAVAAAGARRGTVARIITGASTLATRSLFVSIAAVGRALRAGDLIAARAAVGRVVGRDVTMLDETEVARAAIETLAESFCDGIVAPLLALRFTGLPGAFAFKAISTLDSMIGHRESPYTFFGRIAARLDDACNIVPARIAALAIVAAAAIGGENAASAFAIARSDARGHASPNAGWPEASLAGALGIRLGGTNCYGGLAIAGAIFNRDGEAPTYQHLLRALRVVSIATALVEFVTLTSTPA